MTASSIGQPVVLNEERAKRLMEIVSQLHKPAHSDGPKLTISKRKFDPKKFK